MPDGPSLDVTVLVTRPREQAAPLVEALENRGAAVIALPVIEIVARDRAAVEAEAAGLEPADVTVFVSANAVRHGLDFATGRIAAIGPATAAAIEAAGRQVDIVPRSGFDSESLLAEPDFAEAAGRRVRIVRGVGGREKLARTLAARDAEVDYLEVYERRLPVHDPETLTAIDRRWRNGGIDVAIVMSVESLDNLCRLIPAARDCLRASVLVTPAARVLKEVQDGGSDCPAVLARGPGTGAIVDAVASARDQRPR